MSECRHGTDLTDSDCMNCDNEKEEIEEIVIEAMQYYWNDFVGDTHELPDDFEVSNSRTTVSFTPKQWARLVAESVAKKVPDVFDI